MMSDFREKVFEIIDKVRSMHPYRIPGRRDTYDSYNEAWNDCANQIEVEIEALPYERPDLSEEERIICKQYLEDLDRHKSCNEYKILMSMLDAPTLGTWVPCSERLPEEDHWLGGSGRQFSDNVLVSVANCDDEDIWTDISQTIDGKWALELPRHCKIIAWMPLPKEYGGGDE